MGAAPPDADFVRSDILEYLIHIFLAFALPQEALKIRILSTRGGLRLVRSVIAAVQRLLNKLVVATVEDLQSSRTAWQFDADGSIYQAFTRPQSSTRIAVTSCIFSGRCIVAIRMFEEYRDQVREMLLSRPLLAPPSPVVSEPIESPQRTAPAAPKSAEKGTGRRQDGAPISPESCHSSRPAARSSSGKDAKSQGSGDTVKLLPQNKGLDAKAEDLRPHLTIPRRALAQGDQMCIPTGGQTAVSPSKDDEPIRGRDAERNIPRVVDREADAMTSSSSSSPTISVAFSLGPIAARHAARGSASPEEPGRRDSAALPCLLVHAPPDSSRTSSHDTKARKSQTSDVPAGKQEIRGRASNSFQVLSSSPSGDDTLRNTPSAPRSRPGNPSRTRADDLYEVVARDHVQLRSDEGVACRSSADVRDPTSVALPNRSREKPTSPSSSSGTPTMVKQHVGISSHSSRDTPENSPQRAKHDCDNPAQFSDSDGECRALRASPDSFSPSPSSAPRIHAAREMPDRTSSNGPVAHSSQTASCLHSASVPLVAPLLRSPHRATTGGGPDSANWRVRRRPTTLLLRDVGTVNADAQSGSIDEHERAFQAFNLKVDVNRSPSAGGNEKGSPRDAESNSNVVNSHRPRWETSGQASTQGCLHLSARGQTVVPSYNGVKPRTIEANSAPLQNDSGQDKMTSGSSSSTASGTVLSSSSTNALVARGSHSPNRPGQTDSAASPLSIAHTSPNASRSSSREKKAPSMRDIHSPAIQQVECQPSSSSQSCVLFPSHEDTLATAPSASSSAARAVNSPGARATEAVDMGQIVARGSKQQQSADFKGSGGVSAVEEEKGEGVSCRVSPEVLDSKSIPQPDRFCEKSPSCDTSSCAMLETRTRISSHSLRDTPEYSPRSAERDCDQENTARSPDSENQYHLRRPSSNRRSSSPSSMPESHAARERSDQTTSSGSGTRSFSFTSYSRSATVPSAAPPPRSSRRPTSGSGPDSVNWRALGRPTTLPLREVGIFDAGSRSKSVSEREQAFEGLNLEEDDIKSLDTSGEEKGLPQDAKADANVGNFHRSRSKASSQASAQGYLRVYAGGRMLASSRRDGKPQSSRNTGRCSPQSTGSDTITTAPDDSGCTPAMVEPHSGISPCSSRDFWECSPRSAKDDGGRSPVQFPVSNGQRRARRASVLGLSASTYTASPMIAARELPDKLSDRSGTHSCQAVQLQHPARVPATGLPRRSSRMPRNTSGPETADWQQIVSSFRNDTTPCGSRDRTWLLSRLDAADTTAPSAFRLHFHAFKRGRIPEPLEDSAGSLKRGYAGGQAVLSSCKDVKPLDARKREKDPSPFTASDVEHQHSLSSKPNRAMPPACGGGDLPLGCNGLDVDQGSSCSPDSPPLSSAREAEVIEPTRESGSSTEDDVRLIGRRGHDSPGKHSVNAYSEENHSPRLAKADTTRNLGHCTHVRDSEEEVFALLSMRGPPEGRLSDNAGRSITMLSCVSGEKLKDYHECARFVPVLRTRRVHCASPASALNPLWKDREVAVPDAWDTYLPRGLPDKQAGGNVGVLHVGRPSTDATPRPGGRISLIITDGEWTMGYTLDFYNDPGGPIRVTSSVDIHLSGVCQAQAVSPPHACLSLRELAAHVERAKEAPGRPENGAQPVGDTYASSGRELAHRFHQGAYNTCEKSHGFFGTGKAVRDLAKRGEYVLRKRRNNNALLDVRIVPHTSQSPLRAFSTARSNSVPQASRARSFSRALAPLIKCPFSYAGEIALISEASMGERCRQLFTRERTYLLSPRREMTAPIRAETETGGPTNCSRRFDCPLLGPSGARKLSYISNSSRTMRGNSLQDLVPARLAAEPQEVRSRANLPFFVANQRCLAAGHHFSAALVHKLQQIPLRAQATSNAHRLRPATEELVAFHRYPSRSSGVYTCSVAPGYESMPPIGRHSKYLRVGCRWTVCMVFSRNHDAGGLISQEIRARFDMSRTHRDHDGKDAPCSIWASQCHSIAVSRPGDADAERQLRVSPIALRSAAFHARDRHQKPSARPIHRLRSQICCLYPARLGSLPSALAFEAQSSASFPASSRTISNGVYIRSTPPGSRVCTANGGAQGEVLPCGCEERTTSISASAQWLARRCHSLDRGAPRSKESGTMLADVIGPGTGRVASRLVVEYYSDAGTLLFDLTRARRYTRTTRYPSASAPDRRQRATTLLPLLPTRLARSPLAGTELPHRLPAGTEGRSTAPAGAPAWVAEEQATDEPRTHRLHAHIMLPPDDKDQASGCAIQPEPRIGLQDNHSNAVDEGPATDVDADNAADSVPLPAIPEVSIIAPTLLDREDEVLPRRDPAAPPANSRPLIVAAQEARLEDAEEQDGRATGTDVGPDDESSASAADPASPSPPAEDGFIDSPESTAPAAHVQATTEDDPIWTLVGCRTTKELCPGALQLVIDAGTDGEVGDCQVLLRADFNEAMERLPGICEPRKIWLSQLHLRIGRAQDRQGEDTMLRVMRCLKPYLRFFSAVHLDLKQECDVDLDSSGRFTEFSHLLSLRIEGQANLNHFLSFPLHNLRYLDIKVELDSYSILKIIDLSKTLEVLTLDYASEHSAGGTRPTKSRTQGVRFPPAMFITTDDPKELFTVDPKPGCSHPTFHPMKAVKRPIKPSELKEF
ncbi:uncharacterized protein SCHCODRAFT_01164471 [Schizophyllum commune H4-8]|nr:uncharacterized protein SCHCODRAFT_01164471 [Schizophyllum commune H4-8]KAI5885368.1 hypothetical protein SCHCODRAFT_01164471 [Schizophyllum commune H4-8]